MTRKLLPLLLLALSAPAWGAYLDYVPITIAANMVTATATNKTVFLHFSGNQFKAGAGYIQHTCTFNGQTVPADFVVSPNNAGTSPYSFEEAYWNQSTGDLYVYTLIPSITTAGMTVYGVLNNSAITTYQGGAVGAAWASYHAAVFHGYNGSLLDSTSNANNGGTNYGATADFSGPTGGGWAFNAGSSQYVSIPNSASLNRYGSMPVLVEVLYYASSMPTGGSTIAGLVAKEAIGGAATGYGLAWDAAVDYGVRVGMNGGSNGPVIGSTQNAWIVAVGQWDGGGYWNGWTDGVHDGYSTGTPASNTGPLIIGSDQAFGGYWNGKIAEIRVFNAIPDYLPDTPTTQPDDYNNIVLYSTYLSQGTFVGGTGGGAATLTLTPIIM